MECAGSHLRGSCVGPATLRCGSCGALRYCSRKHQKAHWGEHAEACGRMAEQMQRAPTLCDFPFLFTLQTTQMVDIEEMTICSCLESWGLHGQGLWQAECDCFHPKATLSVSQGMADKDVGWHLPSTLCPCTDPEEPAASLRNWEEYYNWRGLPFDSPVALILHWPLSLFHALCLLQSQTSSNLISRDAKSLHIHYLGPERELNQLPVFGELLALLPSATVHIEFVGPAVPDARDGEVLKLDMYAKCMDAGCACKRSDSRFSTEAFPSDSQGYVSVRLMKGFYHDRHSELGATPDLIFAANAGIAAFPSWQPTVELIEALKVPAFFTDYCEEAAVMAAQAIALTRKSPLKFPVQVNPFRQPLTPSNKSQFTWLFSTRLVTIVIVMFRFCYTSTPTSVD